MENSWFWKRQEGQALIVSYSFAVKASQLTGSVVVSENAGQPWGNHNPLSAVVLYQALRQNSPSLANLTPH